MQRPSSIKEIDYQFISELVENLLKRKLYRSEAQLQFEIAWKLKEALVNLENWDVFLEYVTATTVIRGKSKRLYTDILLFNQTSGQYIPIELKYKTKRYPKTGFDILKNHGAQDLGCYDFWWDTKRIDILKLGSCVVTPYNGQSYEYKKESFLGEFLCGFSILVTNDDGYLNEHPKSCACNLYPHDKRTLCSGSVVDWDRKNPSKFYIGTWRDMPLKFSNTYTCNWSNCINSPPPFEEAFRLLVLEL